MFRRNTQPDYYAVLRVAPEATHEQIAEAYRQLDDLYSVERLHDAAPEFQAQAAATRQQLATAFEILSDPQQRAAYDRRYGATHAAPQQFRAGATPEIDYRPLPPARGHERERSAELAEARREQRSTARSGWRAWLPVIAVALALLAVLLVIVLSPVRAPSTAAARATPVLPNVQLPFNAVQLRQFRAAAERTNSFENWAAFGNALFDNLQTMREAAAQSPQYRNSLGDWLQAADAYERALAIRDDPTVRSDRAIVLLNFGLDAPDPQRVSDAVAEAEQQLRAGVTAPRALLNDGLILAAINPPRTDEALALWRKIGEIAPDSPEAQTARLLIETYGR